MSANPTPTADVRQHAFILAGEKAGSIPVLERYKALLPFRGKPLIAWVIDALDRAETIASITVVGPRAKLEAALAGLATQKPLRFLEQGENIFDNIWQGGLSCLPEIREGIPVHELRHGPAAERAVFGVTCDAPLLEPAEVDHFLRTAPLGRADIVYGFTRREILLPYEPQGGKPGISYIYFCLRDSMLRHANMFTFRPLKLADLMQHHIPIIYQLRYQRHFTNVVSLFKEIMSFSLRPRTLFLYFCLQAAKYFHTRGFPRVRDVFRWFLPQKRIEYEVERIFRTPFTIHMTIGPGPTLDVDDEASYRAFLANYDEWKALQREQLRQALSGPESAKM